MCSSLRGKDGEAPTLPRLSPMEITNETDTVPNADTVTEIGSGNDQSPWIGYRDTRQSEGVPSVAQAPETLPQPRSSLELKSASRTDSKSSSPPPPYFRNSNPPVDRPRSR